MGQVDSKNTPSLAIIGLGYVGLPLAIEFASHYRVVAFDTNLTRIDGLLSGEDSNYETDKVVLSSPDNIFFTHNSNELNSCSIYIICVPTPVNQDNTPDLSNIISASTLVGECLTRGDTVIYESTVFPGATEEICIPLLEEISGLIINSDFTCGYSPERVSPGVNGMHLTDIIKITSGSSEKASHEIDKIYSKIITAGTHRAPSIRVAEASKLLENTQRDVNIALMNEIAHYMASQDINMSDVLIAANTKWNFANYFPGLVGGHCIAVDPYYLIHHAHTKSTHLNLVSMARQVNEAVPQQVAQAIIKRLSNQGKLIKNSRVLVMGLTFKENCNDIRNSKVFSLIDILEDYSLQVDVFDPIAPNDSHPSQITDPFALDSCYSVIIKCVNHTVFNSYNHFDFKKILSSPTMIFDVRSMCFVNNQIT